MSDLLESYHFSFLEIWFEGKVFFKVKIEFEALTLKCFSIILRYLIDLREFMLILHIIWKQR